MAGAALLNPLRRVGISLITRVLRKDVEEAQAKKHPERNQYVTNAITKRRTLKKQQFEKKFPTKAQRKVIKEKKVQAKKNFKQTKKIQKERYESDPLYRAGTVPRQQLTDTTIAFATWNPILPGFRRGLRKEFKHGNNSISKKASWGILKKMSTFVESGQNLHKNFTPKGRKWLKRRNQEDARAKSILSGDV
jgi:hypothetical protein